MLPDQPRVEEKLITKQGGAICIRLKAVELHLRRNERTLPHGPDEQNEQRSEPLPLGAYQLRNKQK